MLGKLFSLGTGSAANASGPTQTNNNSNNNHSINLNNNAAYKDSPQTLESMQEDIHTRNLLFPDTEALYQHRNDQVFPLSMVSALPLASIASAFDYDGDIDLDTRHVRLLIMQDAVASFPAQLLFDSHPAPPKPPSTTPGERPATGIGTVQDSYRGPTSPRKSSLNQTSRPLVIQPDSPQPRQGAFDRRASMQGRAQSQAETDLQRARREYNDEIHAFAGSVFGNSELMAYKGTSTKVHIVPTETRPEYAGSYLGDGRGSIGRSSMRSSRLAQSYTSDNVSPMQPPQSFTSSAPNARSPPERRKILITRLFPVLLPNDDDTQSDTPLSRFSDYNTGFPFPQSADEANAPKKKKPQPKQKRTPMYAVVLVIQLSPTSGPMAPPSTIRSALRGASSYTDQDSFPSSVGSARRSGWTMSGSGFPTDSMESSCSTDVDDRMDTVTQHWDIIMRTLTHLQGVVATTLGTLLRQADISSPDPYPNSVSSYVGRAPSMSGRRNEEPHFIKPPKTNAKVIALQPHCLQNDDSIVQEAKSARVRIVTGLRAQRVITAQGRWGIWRDEARWMARKAGEKEHGFFFFNLLTGFLATHTDWLNAMSPAWYRRKHYQQQKAKGEDDLSLPARTVIIASDKMLARRLIFLLSAFLPSHQHLSSARTHRPSTSTSFGAFSQSPPSLIIPILREESLRRKINRRTGPRRVSHSRTVSQSTRASGVPPQLAHLSMESRHERRVSDAASIRSNLPIPGNDQVSRKSSAATTTTITPETTIPHFTTAQRFENRRSLRPGSSGSVAADDLKRTLKRGESSGHVSSASTDSRLSSSRWGSVISTLWNGKRRDSTGLTTPSYPYGSNPTSPTKSTQGGRRDKLADMVREVRTEGYRRTDDRGYNAGGNGNGPTTPRGFDDQAIDDPIERVAFPERVPDPSGDFRSPVKTSINAEDGIIDVDISFPDYITSFETAVSSPSSSGYLSTPGVGNGLEGFEQFSRITIDGDSPMNVVGFLQQYHQDFILQAVPPQDSLMEDIRKSMRAEPTPFVTQPFYSTEQPADRWVDVSSALIADTTTHTIKRIRYRRLIRPKPFIDRSAPLGSAGSSAYGAAPMTPSILPYETQLDDEFVEEPIASLDEVLIEAVERVIAQSNEVSKQSSSSSSRSTSKRRDRSNSEASVSVDSHHTPRIPMAPQEVPRDQCKTVVLSALDEIIRDVIEERDHDAPDATVQQSDRDRESTLREAVRIWLDAVDSSEQL
ncbi:folliculin-interacting protein N-terminus-domain-containing protein [Colletotrichum cereale]|nr:folliculin-interacting protein N-terminus-domain-containing protein [Colletotrichum cereale]